MVSDNLRDPDKIFFTGYCPACGTGKGRIVKTERPIQTAQCPLCKVRWKILSINLYYADSLQQAAALDEQARMIKKGGYGFLLTDR